MLASFWVFCHGFVPEVHKTWYYLRRSRINKQIASVIEVYFAFVGIIQNSPRLLSEKWGDREEGRETTQVCYFGIVLVCRT